LGRRLGPLSAPKHLLCSSAIAPLAQDCVFLRLQAVLCMLLLMNSNGRTSRVLYAGLDNAGMPKRKRNAASRHFLGMVAPVDPIERVICFQTSRTGGLTMLGRKLHVAPNAQQWENKQSARAFV
jgi:hypothetical protein